MKSLLPFFIPTKVLLIDDKSAVLNMLKSSLNQEIATYKDFKSPITAIEHINKFDAHDIYKKVPQENLFNGHIESYYEEIYDSVRFEQISTIIVDYDMPGMDGLELCKKINSPHIPKIMLTGAASTDIAVEAFNNKIIDYFVRKDDADFIEKLDDYISQAQYKYFSSLTQELMNMASYESVESIGIRDPAFIEFFNTLMQGKNFCEYYLLDAIGTYLLLSSEGKPSALFVFNEGLLEYQEDMIPEDDRNTELAQEVYANKQAICFYPFKNQEKYDPANWKSYLQPLNRLESEDPIFYAYVPDLINLDQTKIVSFKDYLSKSGK